MKRKPRTFLGWSRGLDVRGDETRVWHAVVTQESDEFPGEQIAFAACTRHQRHAGQVEPLPEGARVCRRIGCDNREREQRKGIASAA